MAINRTAFPSTIYTAAVDDPVSPAIALGANPGRAIIGFLSIVDTRSVASVAVTGGDTLASVAAPVSVAGFKRTGAAGLVSQSGSQTVTFDTDSPAPSELKWGEVVAYEGVGSIRSIVIVHDVATTNPTATVTTQPGDKVVMLGISGGAGATCSGVGGTTDFDGGVADRVALEKDAVGTITTIEGLWSGASAWYAVVVVLAPIAAPDTTSPTFTGGSVVTVSNFANGAGTFDAVWPDATDNVAVTGYRWRAVIGGVPGSLNTLVPSSLTGGSGLTPGVSTVIEVEARDAAGNWSAVISSAAFTPGIASTVGTNPSNQSLAVGGDAVFTSTSSAGTPTPTGQWQRNNGAGWVDIPGETSTTYTLVNVQLSDTGAQFRRSYSNGVGAAVNSTAATLTVTPATVIGFKFSTAVGLQIGQFVGAQTGLTLSNAEAWTAFIHNDTTRALLLTSGTLTTSAGRLPDYTNASLSDGTTYFVSFRRTSDGASCSCRIAAEIIP